MRMQLLILGCIIALIAIVAIRIHLMSTEIDWIRARLLEQAALPPTIEEQRSQMGGTRKAPRKDAQESEENSDDESSDDDDVVGAPSEMKPARIMPKTHDQMVASLLGSVVNGGMDVRDRFDEIDDEAEDELVETLRNSIPIPAQNRVDNRIEELTMEERSSDAGSIELEDEGPPP